MSVFDLFIRIVCLFPIFTTLVNRSMINKVIFVALFLSTLLIWFKRGIRKSTLFAMLLLVVHYLYFATKSALYLEAGTNLFFYYPFSVMYMLLVIDYKEEFLESIVQNQRFILGILRLWTIIVGVSIFIPSCYYAKEGGTRFFGSFAQTIFRLGPSAVFIMCIIAVSMSIYKRRQDALYAVVPMYCFFMGSSRTYLVVGLLLFVVIWYWYCNSRKMFMWTFIPLAVIALFIIINSSIGEKVLYTLDNNRYGDFWYRVTSSRSLIWEKDLNAWADSDFISRLFGGGLFFTHHVGGLWAHNDFIEILCSTGIYGFLFYYVLHFRMIRICMPPNCFVPKIIVITVVLSWFFNAFFNMHYVYFCAMLAFPILLMAVNKYYLEHLEDCLPEQEDEYISKSFN